MKNQQQASSYHKALSLVDMSSAFVVFGLGISLSILVFLIELIYKRINDHYFTDHENKVKVIKVPLKKISIKKSDPISTRENNNTIEKVNNTKAVATGTKQCPVIHAIPTVGQLNVEVIKAPINEIRIQKSDPISIAKKVNTKAGDKQGPIKPTDVDFANQQGCSIPVKSTPTDTKQNQTLAAIIPTDQVKAKLIIKAPLNNIVCAELNTAIPNTKAVVADGTEKGQSNYVIQVEVYPVIGSTKQGRNIPNTKTETKTKPETKQQVPVPAIKKRNNGITSSLDEILEM